MKKIEITDEQYREFKHLGISFEDVDDCDCKCDKEEKHEEKLNCFNCVNVSPTCKFAKVDTNGDPINCGHYIEKPKFNEPWNPEEDQKYYSLDYEGDIGCTEFENWRMDYARFDFGNCFKTREQAEQRAKEIKVYNLLKNFSDANGGENLFEKSLNMGDIETQKKYKIIINSAREFILCPADSFPFYKELGVVYFISEEVAEEALRRYKTELEEVV